MARQKPIPVETAGDIPSWFMTYSDVITLLMTFFILLLTFSTTEPDRFDKIQQTLFAGGKGTGIAGHVISGPENDSFVNRIRPRAARMAIQGSEMPPYMTGPSKKSVGEGLKSLSNEESSKNVMTTNQFDVPIDSIVTVDGNLTSQGMYVAALLSSQLRSLPVSVSLQCSDSEIYGKATAFVVHLYQIEKIRPGQVGVSIVENVSKLNVRFAVERFKE